MTAAEGYPTDVPYTFGYYEQISPMALDYVARLSGANPPDLRRPFRFLELGCGNGVSALTFAACFPHAEFVGVDMNEQHVVNARAVAEKGGLSNVAFHVADFRSFGERDDLGGFHFIAFHGVYSWVSPEVRRDMRRIVARTLAPNGVVYCSYNAMPGWAQLLPLRTMMQAYTAGLGGTSAERVDVALGYLRYLREHKARFFAANAAAVAQVDQLLGSERAYLAHEYFTEHFNPFYFREVAHEMGDIGLVYAGSATLTMNHWQLSIPERFREMMDTAPDCVSYETHRSFILNERFRRDVYVRIGMHPLKYAPPEAWDDVRFGPLYDAGTLKRAIDCAAGQAAYQGELYDALTEVLSSKALTPAELRKEPLLASIAPDAIVDGLKLLCASEQFGTFLAPIRDGAAPGQRARLASRFNRAVLDARLQGGVTSVTFASPVTGRGVTVSPIAAVVVLALEDGCAPDSAAEWATAWLDGRNVTLQKDGRALSAAERRVLVTDQVAYVFQSVVPRLLQYGVLENV